MPSNCPLINIRWVWVSCTFKEHLQHLDIIWATNLQCLQCLAWKDDIIASSYFNQSLDIWEEDILVLCTWIIFVSQDTSNNQFIYYSTYFESIGHSRLRKTCHVEWLIGQMRGWVLRALHENQSRWYPHHKFDRRVWQHPFSWVVQQEYPHPYWLHWCSPSVHGCEYKVILCHSSYLLYQLIIMLWIGDLDGSTLKLFNVGEAVGCYRFDGLWYI